MYPLATMHHHHTLTTAAAAPVSWAARLLAAVAVSALLAAGAEPRLMQPLPEATAHLKQWIGEQNGWVSETERRQTQSARTYCPSSPTPPAVPPGERGTLTSCVGE